MPFSLQAASEAMHASIFPNHSMAGNDDRYWISARGRPGGADGLGRPCPVGQVGVGDSFSIGDERDFAPDLRFVGPGAAGARNFLSFPQNIPGAASPPAEEPGVEH